MPVPACLPACWSIDLSADGGPAVIPVMMDLLTLSTPVSRSRRRRGGVVPTGTSSMGMFLGAVVFLLAMRMDVTFSHDVGK